MSADVEVWRELAERRALHLTTVQRRALRRCVQRHLSRHMLAFRAAVATCRQRRVCTFRALVSRQRALFHCFRGAAAASSAERRAKAEEAEASGALERARGEIADLEACLQDEREHAAEYLAELEKSRTRFEKLVALAEELKISESAAKKRVQELEQGSADQQASQNQMRLRLQEKEEELKSAKEEMDARCQELEAQLEAVQVRSAAQQEQHSTRMGAVEAEKLHAERLLAEASRSLEEEEEEEEEFNDEDLKSSSRGGQNSALAPKPKPNPRRTILNEHVCSKGRRVSAKNQWRNTSSLRARPGFLMAPCRRRQGEEGAMRRCPRQERAATGATREAESICVRLQRWSRKCRQARYAKGALDISPTVIKKEPDATPARDELICLLRSARLERSSSRCRQHSRPRSSRCKPSSPTRAAARRLSQRAC